MHVAEGGGYAPKLNWIGGKEGGREGGREGRHVPYETTNTRLHLIKSKSAYTSLRGVSSETRKADGSTEMSGAFLKSTGEARRA